MKIKTSTNYIIFYALAIVVGYCSELSTPNWETLSKIVWVLLAVYAIYKIIIFPKKGSIERKVYSVSVYFSLPIITILIYTIIMSILRMNDTRVITQATTTCAYMFVDILVAYFITSKFKYRAVDFMYYTCLFSYLLGIAKMCMIHGISAVLQNFFNPGAGQNSYIERNDVGTAIMLIALFYLWQLIFSKYTNNKEKRIIIFKFILSLLILFLCTKRSAWLGMAIGVCILLFIKSKTQLKRQSLVLGCMTVLVAFIYVATIRTGVLEYLANVLGIDSSGRIYVWSHMSSLYSLSPLYLGRGFQFSHIYMTYYATNGMVKDFGYVHNTILQLYIELGFVGFFCYFLYEIAFMSNKIGKIFGKQLKMLWLMLYISSVGVYITDNVLTYPLFQTTLFVTLWTFYRFLDVGKKYECINHIKLQ